MRLGLLSRTALAALAAATMAAGAGTLPARADATLAKSNDAQGNIKQLQGKKACVVDRSADKGTQCVRVRGLKDPGTIIGSHAIVVSPDGRHVYAAAAGSNSVAIFTRNPDSGALTQKSGKAGCIAQKGAAGCAKATALKGTNAISMSSKGKWLFVTSAGSSSVTAFARNSRTGALRQTHCVSSLSIPGCDTVQALTQPDTVAVSPDDANVYVGDFKEKAVVTLNFSDGRLTQPEGTSGCIAADNSVCATGIGFDAIEGVAVSPDGQIVVAASPFGNTVMVLRRDSTTGTLTQPADGSGCWSEVPQDGCTTGRELTQADAVTFSADGKSVYFPGVGSHALTSFTVFGNGSIAQKPGVDGCMVDNAPVATGCRLMRKLPQPEGVAVTPDGRTVYAVSPANKGSVAVLTRNPKTGNLEQKRGKAGCMTGKSVKTCSPGRALAGATSVAVSPDGRNVYTASSSADAVAVFKRIK